MIWSGTALTATVVRDRAYLATGKSGTTLVAIDLGSGKAVNIGRIPPFIGTLTSNVDGMRLAGVAYGAPAPGAPRSRTVLIDVERRPVGVRTSPLGSANVSGAAVWLADGRLAVFPSDEVDVVRVYDGSLRVRATFPGWSARGAALVGTSVYGVDWGGRLLRATLPTGPVRVARRLPSPVAYVIVAT